MVALGFSLTERIMSVIQSVSLACLPLADANLHSYLSSLVMLPLS